jgi:hypothetical protein
LNERTVAEPMQGRQATAFALFLLFFSFSYPGHHSWCLCSELACRRAFDGASKECPRKLVSCITSVSQKILARGNAYAGPSGKSFRGDNKTVKMLFDETKLRPLFDSLDNGETLEKVSCLIPCVSRAWKASRDSWVYYR